MAAGLLVRLAAEGSPEAPAVGGLPIPALLYAGPKDTVLLLEEYTGIYMYHCHLLEHEDAGMMGQFMVK